MAGGGVGTKVLGIGAGILGRKVATSGWKLATGSAPPADPADRQTSWREALAWAAASGAVMQIARLLTTRKVADYWAKSTEEPPPGGQGSSS